MRKPAFDMCKLKDADQPDHQYWFVVHCLYKKTNKEGCIICFCYYIERLHSSLNIISLVVVKIQKARKVGQEEIKLLDKEGRKKFPACTFKPIHSSLVLDENSPCI